MLETNEIYGLSDDHLRGLAKASADKFVVEREDIQRFTRRMWEVRRDGELILCVGVMKLSPFSDPEIWLLFYVEFLKKFKMNLRGCRRLVNKLLEIYPKLRAHVAEHKYQDQRFAKFFGFKPSNVIDLMHDGKGYRRYNMACTPCVPTIPSGEEKWLS